MAMPPGAEAAAPAADDTTAPMPDAGDDTDAADTGEDDSNVLLTVLKEGDGTYRLIQGDEDDAASAPADDGGMGDVAAGDSAPGKVYDSKGALLKAVLDILNEDESSGGADGSSEDQFQTGFGGAAAAPAAPIAPAGATPQKY